MKRSFDLLLGGRYRPLFIVCYRFVSSKKCEGLIEKFDENEARLYFDKWLKSLWFTPGGWIQSTRDNTITVTRRYLPFWNLSLNGSINAYVSLSDLTSSKYGKHFDPALLLHSDQLMINNVSLNDINIYAAQTLDRHHLNQLNISFDKHQIVNLTDKENHIEQWTVDRDTAFHIGWDLNILPQIKKLCTQQGKRTYPSYTNHQAKSFHFDINSIKERLLYYPIYVINYQYGYLSTFTCLVDGITGQVTGERQYSMTKTTLATFIVFYPMTITALITLGLLIDPSISIALASFLTLKNTLSVAFLVAPLAGLGAKYYPKLYRRRIRQQQWAYYRSYASQFTYDFTTPFQKQYQSYKQQKRESGEEGKVPMELYNLLSISPTANERAIKHAYLSKAKELHPDRNLGDKKCEELSKRVNQAYTVLSDQYKRKLYDQYGYDSVKYD